MAPEDRHAARRSLAHLITPTEALIQVKSGAAEFLALVHTVEVLMEIAHPLSPALVQRLEPWLAESRRRRQDLIIETRPIDARRASMGDR